MPAADLDEATEAPRRSARLVGRAMALRTGAAATAVAMAGVGVLVTRDAPTAEPVATTSTTTSSTSTTSTIPPPVVPVSTELASPNGSIAAYDAPGGRRIGSVGRWYGYRLSIPILAEQDGWLQVMMPERPNGLTAWVRADQVTRGASAWRLVLHLGETRLRVYEHGVEVWSAPVGIGKDSTRTPTGSYFVTVVQRPGPRGYGPVVVSTNAHSEDIRSWRGSGDALTAFHGPFGSEEVLRAGGGKVSNGCIRMLPEDQIKLDAIPVGTPVDIVP